MKPINIYLVIGPRDQLTLEVINDLSKRNPSNNLLVCFEFHKNHEAILQIFNEDQYDGLILTETQMPDFPEKTLERLILEVLHLLPQDVVFEIVYARKKLH